MSDNTFFCIVTLAICVPMAVLCFWAGFYNWVHFVLSAIMATLAIMALFDDSEGESLYHQVKDYINVILHFQRK